MSTIGIDGTAENAVVVGNAISLTINNPPLDGSNNTNSNFVNDLGQAAQQLQQFARTNPTVGAAKTLLQGVALVPGLGTASSVVLLGIDLAQGDYAGVVGDALGLIPLGGGELAAGSRLAREASAIGREAQEVGIIENAVRTCGAGSFTAGTSVLTDRGSRPIEDVKVGERVLSRDERTGAQDWHFVMATTVNKEPVYKLHLHGQEEGDPQDELGVSAEHPFWVKAKGWTAAEELKSDSEVQDVHGEWLQVGSFEPQLAEQTTYNLTVEGSHSFFVGQAEAWVHNGKCSDIVTSNLQTLSLGDKAWRKSTFTQNGLVYILKDANSGQLLKVGQTTAKTFEGRFEKYITSGKRSGKNLVLDVFEVPLAQRGKIEGEIRKFLGASPGSLPWDNAGLRLGRPGKGIP